MTLLVRSRAFSLVLLFAFGAFGTEATLRRKATEDTSLTFTDVDIAEATESETTGSISDLEPQVPADLGEDSVGIPEEEEDEPQEGNPDFLPPLDNFDQAAQEQAEQRMW